MGFGYKNKPIGTINVLQQQFGNITVQKETDYSILTPGTYVWNRKEFYFKPGDKFPTDSIEDRADMYLTNDTLYETDLSEVYQNVFSWNDQMRDMLSNNQIFKIDCKLDDFKSCTETWVDLMGAKPPRVDGKDSKKILQLSNVLTNSNFAEAYRSAIRGSQFMYGNKVFRVDKLEGGSVKVVDLPVKCWIPFVNQNDVSSIEVNVLFNIYENESNEWYCEFVCYAEDGGIKKYTFAYNKANKTLGEMVEEAEYEEAFDGAGVSPIVVFTGNTLNGSVFGHELYSDWDAAIASNIRAYEAIMIMIERAKEITRLVPADAVEKDDYSGVRYLRQSGALAYANSENPPKVEYIVPTVNMEQAIEAYKITRERLAIATALSSTFFNIAELKSNASGETLKASMYRTDLKSKSITTLLQRPLKQLIYKMGLAAGLEVDIDEFDTVVFNGFIQDLKQQMEITQARLGSNGNIRTISEADAIAVYDDVPMSIAVQRAQELQGIKVKEESGKIETTDSGGESEVTNGIAFTPGITAEDNKVSKSNTSEAFIMGGDDIV